MFTRKERDNIKRPVSIIKLILRFRVFSQRRLNENFKEIVQILPILEQREYLQLTAQGQDFSNMRDRQKTP